MLRRTFAITHIPVPMRTCEQRDELQRRLRAAFEEWYGVKDVRERTVRRKPPRRRFSTFSVRSATMLRSTDATGTSEGPQLLINPHHCTHRPVYTPVNHRSP